MFNRIVLIGRLCRDPELKYLDNGTAVASLRLAVDQGYGDQKTAFFLDVSCFGKTAEFVGQYVAKGRLVSVDGRLQERKWTGRDGEEKKAFEVRADAVQGLDHGRSSASSDPKQEEAGDPYDPTQGRQQGYPQQRGAGGAGQGGYGQQQRRAPTGAGAGRGGSYRNSAPEPDAGGDGFDDYSDPFAE